MLIPYASTPELFGEMRGLFRRMDEAFRDFDGPKSSVSGAGTWPPMELRDDGDTLVLQAELPGMTEKEISIEATQDRLTISGEKKVELPQGYTAHRQERRSIRFARSFALPYKIDLEQVQASVKNGVLRLQATKVPEQRPKQIAVTAS